MHAQRHRDTSVRWHFVAEGLAGEDFSLITDDDRPMTKKQLADEIGEDKIYDSPTEYRAAIDQRLFGLGAERHEQLLTLILTLRRPMRAKNLDPVKLSETLTDGLRPIDEGLIAEAARSFDDMEAARSPSRDSPPPRATRRPPTPADLARLARERGGADAGSAELLGHGPHEHGDPRIMKS